MIDFILGVWCVGNSLTLGWLLWRLRRRKGAPKEDIPLRERWIMEQAQHPKGSPKWRAYDNRLRELDGY